MNHLPYWIDIYFRTCHVKIKQKSQSLLLTIICIIKALYNSIPSLSISYRVCGLMIIWKYFSIQIHNPSALQVLQGDSKWEEEKRRRGEWGVFPVKDCVAMRRWGSVKLLLLSFHRYTVLSNAYNINSAGFFWARTHNVFLQTMYLQMCLLTYTAISQ